MKREGGIQNKFVKAKYHFGKMSGVSEENKAKIKTVLSEAETLKLRWPKTEEWQGDNGKKKKMQEIYSFLTARDFNVQEAINGLIDKFGQEQKVEKVSSNSQESYVEKSEVKDEEGINEKKPKKKRESKKKNDSEEDGDEDIEDGDSSPKPKKKVKKESTSPKKTETYAVESNRGIGEVLLEMASLYYKAGEGMKGGVFSRGAKVIREVTYAISTGKEAMKEKGIGKGIGAIIDEFLAKGFVEKLEKMRAGEV